MRKSWSEFGTGICSGDRAGYWRQSLVPVSVPVTWPGTVSGDRAWYRFRYRISLVIPVLARKSSPAPNSNIALTGARARCDLVAIYHARPNSACI